MITCKVSKIEELIDAEVKNNIEVGYSKIGLLYRSPKVGECMFIGSLRTSQIQEILEYDLVKTINSIYKIDYVEVKGLFVDSEDPENIKSFYKAEGLYEIEGKKYVVGRINSDDLVPSNDQDWLTKTKKVIEMSNFIFNWFEVSKISFKDTKVEYDTIWANWKDQNIGVSGAFEGYSK